MPTLGTRRIWKRSLLVGLLLVVGVAAYYYVDRRWPYYHFRTVEPGVFYRSSQLTGEELEDAIERYGFRTIVNLRTVEERSRGDWYAQEQAVAKKRGVQLVDIPLRGDQPPGAEHIPTLLGIFDDPARQPVLVHCEMGSIRSAAVEGLYRREFLGEDGQQALDNVETWSHDLEQEYPGIARFIREYAARPRPR